MTNALDDLYAATHGQALDDISARPLGQSKAERTEAWRRIWRALSFDKAQPTGSSRLLELALPLSIAGGGSPKEMLRALFGVVSANHAIESAYEFFIESLWIAVISSKTGRWRECYDCLEVSDGLSPRQAYLVARFWRYTKTYSPQQVRCVVRALEGQAMRLVVDVGQWDTPDLPPT